MQAKQDTSRLPAVDYWHTAHSKLSCNKVYVGDTFALTIIHYMCSPEKLFRQTATSRKGDFIA